MKMNTITSCICIALGMALGVGCACATPAQDHSPAGAVTPVQTPGQTPEQTYEQTPGQTSEQTSSQTSEQTTVVTVATAEPTPVPEAMATPVTEWGSVTIASGDSLWSIAGESEVYGDSMLWPILYKANRDVIADPDLIQPDQVLKYPSNPSDAQKDEALREAEGTPPYVPHTVPGKDFSTYN
jgi:nucleoid-associated protein YgaU